MIWNLIYELLFKQPCMFETCDMTCHRSQNIWCIFYLKHDGNSVGNDKAKNVFPSLFLQWKALFSFPHFKADMISNYLANVRWLFIILVRVLIKVIVIWTALKLVGSNLHTGRRFTKVSLTLCFGQLLSFLHTSGVKEILWTIFKTNWSEERFLHKAAFWKNRKKLYFISNK